MFLVAILCILVVPTYAVTETLKYAPAENKSVISGINDEGKQNYHNHPALFIFGNLNSFPYLSISDWIFFFFFFFFFLFLGFFFFFFFVFFFFFFFFFFVLFFLGFFLLFCFFFVILYKGGSSSRKHIYIILTPLNPTFI